jgi:hypothetical protein
MELTVKSQEKRVFEISDENNIIAELIYPKWYSYDAELKFNNSEYQFKSVGFWGTKLVLNQNDKSLFSFRLHWNGGLEIKDIIKEESYFLESKGIFKRTFNLFNNKKEHLATLVPDYKWNKLEYEYLVSTDDEFFKSFENKLLIFSVIYGVNYCIAMESGAIVIVA